MQAHQMLDLLVHTTDELENEIGERIILREQMHAWPLSSVESLTTAAGERFVYKVQREPTVEPEFFARAATRLLPSYTILQRDARQAALLLPFLDLPTLRDKQLDELAFVTQGRTLVEQIGQIGGAVPVYIDVGTVETWRAFAKQTLEMLSALVQAGIFTQIERDDIAGLARWAQSSAVLGAIDYRAGD